MPPNPPEAHRVAQFAATGLALMAIVVFVSAAIRLGAVAPQPLPAGAFAILRGIHRVAASLDAVVIFALAWYGWRLRHALPRCAYAAWLALALAIVLSVLGVIGGRAPGPALSLGNLVGGLALAATLAWTLGQLRRTAGSASSAWSTSITLGLTFVQCVLGGWLAIVATDLWSPLLLVHVLFGALLMIGMLRVAAARGASGARRGAMTLVVIAFAAPAAGSLALLLAPNFAASLAHAAAVAALVIALVHTRARFA